jgi:hypothetical protein
MQSKMRDGALGSIPPALAAIQETNGLRATPPSSALRLLALRRGGECQAQTTPGRRLAHPFGFLWSSHARLPDLPVLFMTPFLETWAFIPIAQDVLRTVLRTVRVPGSHRQGEAGSRGGPCSQEPVPPGIGLLNNPASSALHAPLGLGGRPSPTSSTHARCDSSRVAAG